MNPILDIEGSEYDTSDASLGIKILMIVGLIKAINVQTAACNPGVFVKKSRQSPNKKPTKLVLHLVMLKGSHNM